MEHPVTRHLAYTLALDHPPGSVGHRTMAKFLALSLLRTRFSGDIVVFRNSPAPLFMVPRAGVREVFIEAGKPRHRQHFWNYAQAWKFRVHEHLDVRGYDKVLFLDADCLALRNINAMLAGDWDLAYYPEPGSSAGTKWFNCFVSREEAARTTAPGVNGGILAVRAAHYHEVMAEWERINFGPAPRKKFFADQAALTRLVMDTGLRKKPLVVEDVAAPFAYHPHPTQYFESRLVHLAGSPSFEHKLRFMFGLYMNTFFLDQQATLLHILDL